MKQIEFTLDGRTNKKKNKHHKISHAKQNNELLIFHFTTKYTRVIKGHLLISVVYQWIDYGIE